MENYESIDTMDNELKGNINNNIDLSTTEETLKSNAEYNVSGEWKDVDLENEQVTELDGLLNNILDNLGGKTKIICIDEFTYNTVKYKNIEVNLEEGGTDLYLYGKYSKQEYGQTKFSPLKFKYRRTSDGYQFYSKDANESMDFDSMKEEFEIILEMVKNYNEQWEKITELFEDEIINKLPSKPSSGDDTKNIEYMEKDGTIPSGRSDLKNITIKLLQDGNGVYTLRVQYDEKPSSKINGRESKSFTYKRDDKGFHFINENLRKKGDYNFEFWNTELTKIATIIQRIKDESIGSSS